MDAYPQNRYMRPPQPPLQHPPPPDPHLHHYRPPAPPQPTWYSNQFQYQQLPPSSNSPSHPPPQQWPAQPPPPPPPQPSYPPPPPPPPALPHHQQQFPPPPPPSYSHISQSYPQDWGASNWGHQQQQQQQQHQVWDYQAHNNAEDWAARARAWAAQKPAIEDQYPQPQYSQVGRAEEQTQLHEQYQQPTDSHYPDFQQQQYSAPGYQQFPVSAAAPHQPMSYPQENASFNSGPSSNVSDARMSYTIGGGTSAVAPSTNPSVLLQEVPSSYSSVTGTQEATDQKDQSYKSLPLPTSSTLDGQHHMQQSLPAHGGSIMTEQPFAYSIQGADPTADLSNQPLNFVPNFNREQDPRMQPGYASLHDSAGNARGLGPTTSLPSINSWTPTAGAGSTYPQIPHGPPSGHQHDPSVAMPSPVSGHSAPPFGSFPGPNFQPTMPSAGLSYGLNPGSALHPTAGFSGDAYGISNVSERPKKAPMPNWLKEEIIKTASGITRSTSEHAKDESQSIEDEGMERSYGKADQVDSKSNDSSRSTEEEDEDEDDGEAARTAAINQEIKRVLTEVLLKVTDELFDEIATKVLNEDDLNVEVEPNTSFANNKVSPSAPEVPTPEGSSKVSILGKSKEPEPEDISEKSSSSAPGNVLGLAYASDDDEEDDAINSSSAPNSKNNEVLQQSNTPQFLKDVHGAAENGSSAIELGKNSKQKELESDLSKISSVEAKPVTNVSSLRDFSKEKEHVTGETQDKEAKMKSDGSRYESNRSYSRKDDKDTEVGSKKNEKGNGNHGEQDETHRRKEKRDDRIGTKEKKKERGDRTVEKEKASESGKRFHHDGKEERKESEKSHRSNAKEDDNRKRGRTKEKEEDKSKDKEEDRSRHKHSNDSIRRKRRRSSSTSSRGRNSKDKNSTDEASDDSKRKTHSRKRNLSPSPVRSRRRQVSRSPHSKHSQRRHSPYSSLETSRRRRSRSKSPARWRK